LYIILDPDKVAADGGIVLSEDWSICRGHCEAQGNTGASSEQHGVLEVLGERVFEPRQERRGSGLRGPIEEAGERRNDIDIELLRHQFYQSRNVYS
jgi:hypothetical protein